MQSRIHVKYHGVLRSGRSDGQMSSMTLIAVVLTTTRSNREISGGDGPAGGGAGGRRRRDEASSLVGSPSIRPFPGVGDRFP